MHHPQHRQRRHGQTVLAGFLLLGVAAALPAQQTTRVSVSSAGLQTDRASNRISISQDGLFVSFESNATNLVAGDTNFVQDVFARDLVNGITERVSVGNGGVQGNGESKRSVISGDGRYVAFISLASNFAIGDLNLTYDIFVRDRLLGTTTLVSQSTAGIIGNGLSTRPAISADGRYVAFRSLADNLVAGDFNFVGDIFVRDLVAGTTELISVSSTGLQANAKSDRPSISADGRYVAFYSDADNLVVGDTNLTRDIFVRDRLLGTTVRVSVSSTGVEGNGPSSRPSISADGRYVAYRSLSSNLVPGDTNLVEDVFVHDLQTGTTTRVSVASSGAEGNGGSTVPAISGDGRYVAFRSLASNLVPGDINNAWDVFVHDTLTGTTTMVSLSTGSFLGNGNSTRPSVNGDGSRIAFQSLASNLVLGDTNLAEDVFVREGGGALPPPLKDAILLSGPSTTTVGARATWSWSQAPPNSQWWLVYSFNTLGFVYAGHSFDVGNPVTILALGVHDATGSASWTSPPIPASASGSTVYLEVAAQDTGMFYDSNVLPVLIN